MPEGLRPDDDLQELGCDADGHVGAERCGDKRCEILPAIGQARSLHAREAESQDRVVKLRLPDKNVIGCTRLIMVEQGLAS